MPLKYVFLIVGITILAGLTVIIPIIYYYENNKPAAVERRRLEAEQKQKEYDQFIEAQKQEQLIKEREAIVVKELKEKERIEKEEREIIAKREEQIKLKEKLKKDAINKRVEQQVKEYNELISNIAKELKILHNLAFTTNDITLVVNHRKKVESMIASLKEPETMNEKQIDSIRNLRKILVVFTNNIESSCRRRLLMEALLRHPDFDNEQRKKSQKEIKEMQDDHEKVNNEIIDNLNRLIIKIID
jgi:hypothetical protein